MAMTAAQQTDAYRFFAIAFNAAPGVEFMNQIALAYQGGASTKQVVNTFTEKTVFTNAYPLFLTNAQFAERLVNNVVGASASDAAKLEAKADIVSALNGGATRGDVIFNVFSNLAGLTGDAKWGGTAAQMANQVAVARYYTETLGRTSTDVATLQAVIAGVTNTSDVSMTALEARLNPPAAVTPKSMTLSSGVDSGAAFVGTSAADTYVAGATGHLAAYDTINGGAGDDTLVVSADVAIEDTAFTTVASVEKLNLFSNSKAALVHQLGAKAAAAGINAVTLLGTGQNINLTGFNKAVTVTGTDFDEAITANLGDDGDKTIRLGLGAKTVSLNKATTDTAGSTKVSFVSADVGNGVGSVKVDGSKGDITLENTGITIIGDLADQFNVIGSDASGALVEAQNRGNFQTIVLGTSAANTLDLGGTSGNVYINAGAGADKITATAAAGERHFLVGGAGADAITVTTAAATTVPVAASGLVVVLAGDDNDTVDVTAASFGRESINGGAGNDTVTYAAGAALTANGAATTNDSLDGGDGTDTLAGTSAQLTGIAAPTGTQVRSIANFEAVTVSDALVGNLTLSNVQAGLSAVTVAAGTVGGNTVTFDAGVGGTVTLGAALGGALTVASAGTGTTDTLTITNGSAATGTPTKTAVNVFNGQGITGTGVETLVLNGTGTGSATAGTQTVGAISLTGSGTTPAATAVVFEGSVAFSTGAITANRVNAAGLTKGLIASTSALDVTGGSGDDQLTFTGITAAAQAATTTAAAVAAKDATIAGGEGKDTITINAPTGTGTINVVGGNGDDTLNLVERATAKLNVMLGAGSDKVTVAAGAINATDTIDAGEGTDTLQLNIVGSSNIGAFSNFEVFDVNQLAKTLDVDILASRNTVTEFISTGDVGAGATLTNIGAGVGYRATNDSATNAITLTQKAGGALTVTLDKDQPAGADAAATTAAAAGSQTASIVVNATNATSVNAVFDSSFLLQSGTVLVTDRDLATINLTAAAAARVSVVSGGANSFNTLNLTAGAATALTISGDRPLTLAGTTAVLASVDGSAATGGLTANLTQFKDGASLKLGTGMDVITVTNSSTTTGFEKIDGFEKALSVAVATAASDAKTAAIADTDKLVLAGAAVAADGAIAGGTIAKGVLTFTGAGPATLAAAIGIADAVANNNTVVFQYLGNSYVFVQGGVVADTLVELTGVTGVTNLAGTGTADNFFIV